MIVAVFATVALVAAAAAGESQAVADDPATIFVDLAWWQGAVAILAALGLSPAPWLIGLATNRLQFTGPAAAAYEARVAELTRAHAAAIAEIVAHHARLIDVKDTQYSEMKESRNYYRAARLAEVDRADKATDQLAGVVEVVKANVQLLDAFDKAVQEVRT